MEKSQKKTNYKKVQFLAWEIYTGPIRDDRGNAIDYAGIRLQDGGRRVDRRWDVLAQCIDIEARLEATRRAMETALLWADPDEEVLKIFMAPEFLYRGPAGAYLYDLLDGWLGVSPFGSGVLPPPFDNGWGGLAGGLKWLAADPQFENWIFAFGTAIGASFAHQWGDDAAAVNISFVQRGGPSHTEECYYVEKHLKSWMDFVAFNLNHPAFSDGDVEYDSRRDWPVLDRLIYNSGTGGGSLFSFPSVCRSNGQSLLFGLEICLDHARSYEPNIPVPVTGRLAQAGERVDIQLVPSCGMSLMETSLSLAPAQGPRDRSYAFNCDGNGSIFIQGAPWRLGGHVELWSQTLDGAGVYHKDVLQEVRNIYDDPDQTPPPPDDPTQSRHFQIPEDVIDVSGRVQIPVEVEAALGIDLQRISPYTLWRSHEDFPPGRDPQIAFWPRGLGFVRRLPPELL